MIIENMENVLESTKDGLETGLTVRHITTYALETCEADADVVEVLNDPRMQSFDCIPVRANGVIIGCVWRSSCRAGRVSEYVQPLTESLLVSAYLPLTQFIPIIAETSHRLVLHGASIRGIVTWSDLQKLPVRLFAFSLITHLEMVMAQTIRARFTHDEEWLQMISPGRRQHIEEKRQALQRKNLEPPLIELTDFCDKRDILAKRLKPGKQFLAELKAIEALRNTTAHAGSYAESPEAVREFIHCLQATERCTDFLIHVE